MNYVDNMSYVKQFELRHELSWLCEYFLMNHLKSNVFVAKYKDKFVTSNT